MELHHYIIAILGGAFAGAINTLAGNGSAITLTILTEVLNLPGNMANGTNRIGVFAQSFAGTYAFYRNGKLDLARSKVYIILIILGAIAGVITAILVSNEQFLLVFRYMMVIMLFVILVKPKRWLRETDATAKPNIWLATPLFLALGFYGGFIQMGMGIFFLALMVLFAKFSLIDANAVKSFVVAIYTIGVIVIFQWKGLIDWKIGSILAIGQTVGGYFTAHYASRYKNINLWAHRLLVIVVILAILKIFNVHIWWTSQ
ncbi:MAG: sulfite exporter TauE/SafE family protein [Bacteroidetes bacterium]|nr:sulfite exporter TauE/SafE family protein [Bacteroidota bacterium]